MVGSTPGSGDRPDNPTDATPVDQVLEVLQHRLRRDVIEYFLDASERTAAVDDLVAHLAREWPGDPPSRERLSVVLYHHHLPRLADAGIVEFDPELDSIRYYPDAAIEEWLTWIQDWQPEHSPR